MFNKLNKFIRSIFFLFGFIIIMFITLPFIYFILSILRLSSHELNYRVFRFHFRLMLWASGFRIKCEGLENLPKECGVILISNHQSLSDPFVLTYNISMPFRTIIIEAFGKVPWPTFFYTGIKMGFVPIRTGLKDDPKKSIDRLVEIVNKGESILIFPEGTTTEDGSLRRFKLGASQVAFYSGRPVVPIALKGCFEIFPPIPRLFRDVLIGRSRFGILLAFLRVLLSMLIGFNPGEVKIKIGKPMVFSEYKEASLDAFIEMSEKMENEVRTLLQSL